MKNTDEAIKELYGVSKAIPNIINIIPKELNRYSVTYYVSLNINFKIKMSSIAIFSDDLSNVQQIQI